MTANVMQGDREKCIEAGMNDYVAKPIEPEKLHEMLAKWLKNKNMVIANNEQLAIQHKADTATDDTPIFDYEVMNSMLMGDKALMTSIATAFQQDIALHIEQLKSALEKAETNEIASLAHKIKGAAGNVGGKKLSLTALNIEKAAKVFNVNLARQYTEQIETDFVALKEEMIKALI
jgi:HPt (histidine-containing phosphotransfer) domain-containing protein